MPKTVDWAKSYRDEAEKCRQRSVELLERADWLEAAAVREEEKAAQSC